MNNNLGKFLKELREQKDLSLRDVEKVTGISNAYLSQIENNHKVYLPKNELLEKLSNFYEVTIDVLLEKAGYKDIINHPVHYNMGKIEVIDAIEDWQLEFHEANVVKYVARAKRKNKRLEDLKKAAWYLNRKIEMLESLEKCPTEITDYLDGQESTLVTDLIKEREAKDG